MPHHHHSHFLQQQDLFGHQVRLNFNREGESFNTRLGGFLSILFKGLLFSYFVIKLRSLITLSNNQYGYIQIPINDEVGKIEMEKEGLMIYFVYRGTSWSQQLIYDAEEVEKYFTTLSYINQWNSDGNLTNTAL